MRTANSLRASPGFAAVLLLVLSLSTGGGLRASDACGGACCAPTAGSHAFPPAAHGAQHGGHDCCGGPVDIPCDLEQGTPTDGLNLALSGSVRGVTPDLTVPLAVETNLHELPTTAGPWLPSSLHRGRAPPGPIYLKHLSLLC